MTTTVLH